MLLIALFACSGESAEAPPAPLQAAKLAVPETLVAQTWQVRLAKDADRAAFEGRASWTAYFKGDRVGALNAMASENDPAGLARMHAEFAAMYEEAAIMAANSIAQVYGVDGQSTDPVETAFLLGEAGVILGDAELQKGFGKSGASSVPGLAGRDAAWQKWRDAGGAPAAGPLNWPVDDIAALLPKVTPGQAPGLPAELTWTLPEQTPEHLSVKAADLMALHVLAQWHGQAAMLATAGGAPPVDAFALMDAHRLPAYTTFGWRTVSPATAPATPTGATPLASDATLFLGPYATGGDLALAQALRDPRTAAGAVAAHLVDSPDAAILQSCTTAPAAAASPGTASAADGASSSVRSGISVDCVLDQSAALGTAIQDAMAKAAGGPQDFHRFFADQARAGVLRVASDAAFAAGDTDVGGRLRLNAIDKAVGKAYDPVFAVQVAAWDAGNRNSVRATEMIHQLVDEIPGLDVARIPLDALHVRLSRSAAPAVPMH